MATAVIATRRRCRRVRTVFDLTGHFYVRRRCELITAYVLIQTEVGEAGQVARAAAEIEGVQQAQPVVGPYDVIVRAEARSMDALGRLVVSRIQVISGVTRTLTCSVVHL
jgi:DNA-binding Lrp family transcriptional regulator